MFTFMSSPIPYVYVYVSMCLNLKNSAGMNILQAMQTLGKVEDLKAEVISHMDKEHKKWEKQINVPYSLNPA